MVRICVRLSQNILRDVTWMKLLPQSGSRHLNGLDEQIKHMSNRKTMDRSARSEAYRSFVWIREWRTRSERRPSVTSALSVFNNKRQAERNYRKSCCSWQPRTQMAALRWERALGGLVRESPWLWRLLLVFVKLPGVWEKVGNLKWGVKERKKAECHWGHYLYRQADQTATMQHTGGRYTSVQRFVRTPCVYPRWSYPPPRPWDGTTDVCVCVLCCCMWSRLLQGWGIKILPDSEQPRFLVLLPPKSYSFLFAAKNAQRMHDAFYFCPFEMEYVDHKKTHSPFINSRSVWPESPLFFFITLSLSYI